jgi:site-specific recombinase XerD
METLSSAIEWFIGHCANHRKLSAHTLKAYRRDLKLFGDFVSEHSIHRIATQIEAVNKTDVQNWIALMARVKPRTIRRRLATVKSMFSTLERQGHLAIDPLARFRSEIRVGSSLPRVISRSTVKCLLRSSKRLAQSDTSSRERMNQEVVLSGLCFTNSLYFICNRSIFHYCLLYSTQRTNRSLDPKW